MANFSSLFERAVREHANTRGAKGSRSLYNADLTRWLKWCEDNSVDPAKPSLAEASSFKDHLAETQGALTIRRTLASLAAMYGHAVNQEEPLASWNPWKSVPRPPADAAGQTEAVSDADAEKIIAAAETSNNPLGWRDAAVMRLMFETGMRRKSVAGILRDDVVQREGSVVIRIVVKGGRRAEVTLTADATQAIGEWLKHAPESKYLFPALRGNKALHPTAVNKLVEQWAKKVGVEVHPHSFRAAFATSALDAGMPLHEVQAAMHHKDPKTTLRYDRGVRGTGVTNAVSEYRKGRK